MKKKKWLIPLCIVLVLAAAFFAVLGYMSSHSMSLSCGRCILLSDGGCMLIVDETPILLSNRTDKEDLFDGLTSGDEILVLHDGIQESYPARTGAYALLKTADGEMMEGISESVLNSISELYGQKLGEFHGGYIPFYSAELLRTRNYYERKGEMYTSALNSDKMAISSVWHLPIHKIETMEELENFRKRFSRGDAGTGLGGFTSFDEWADALDEGFFEENTLLLVYVSASSGSLRYSVSHVALNEDSLCVHVIQHSTKGRPGTDDLASWFAAVSMEKSFLENCEFFDADLTVLRPVVDVGSASSVEIEKYDAKTGKRTVIRVQGEMDSGMDRMELYSRMQALELEKREYIKPHEEVYKLTFRRADEVLAEVSVISSEWFEVNGELYCVTDGEGLDLSGIEKLIEKYG